MDKITTIEISKYFPTHLLNANYDLSDVKMFYGSLRSGKSRLVQYFWEEHVDKIPIKVELDFYDE